MSKKKIYISLPITGRDFDEVKSEILYVSGVLEMKGYRVVTPIDFDVNPDLDKPYHELLGNDIKALMGCDEVCLCPGWEKSKGCRLEHFAAKLWDKDIMEFERLKCSKIWKEKKLNFKPFDLEAAKAGKPVCTRDGRKARIICFDRKLLFKGISYPIIALVEDTAKEETIYGYNEKGKVMIEDDATYKDDLMMLPQKKEGWVNVYKSYNVGKKIHCMASIYPTKEEAKKSSVVGFDYVDTVKIEWEE